MFSLNMAEKAKWDAWNGRKGEHMQVDINHLRPLTYSVAWLFRTVLCNIFVAIGMSKEDAMKQYVEEAEKLKGKYGLKDSSV